MRIKVGKSSAPRTQPSMHFGRDGSSRSKLRLEENYHANRNLCVSVSTFVAISSHLLFVILHENCRENSPDTHPRILT